MPVYYFDDIALASVILRGIALIPAFILLVLTFTKADASSILARSGITWLRAFGTLFILANIFAVTSMVLSRVDFFSVGPSERQTLYNVSLHIPALGNVIQLQAFATAVMAQLMFAKGLGQTTANSQVSTTRVTRNAGLAVYLLTSALNLGLFIAYEITIEHIQLGVYYDSDTAADRAALSLEFVIALMICTSAFSMLIYTIAVSKAPRRNIHWLLIAAAVATFARSMFTLVVTGMINLNILNGRMVFLHIATSFLTTIFDAWFPLLAFSFIMAALWRRRGALSGQKSVTEFA
ncbi:hypothetical protein HJFPF1_05423 [Paramyrothecium foliicola]|nr:hypothetical protein HJFPF1_05423 [Paramyrothecium foliicola]